MAAFHMIKMSLWTLVLTTAITTAAFAAHGGGGGHFGANADHFDGGAGRDGHYNNDGRYGNYDHRYDNYGDYGAGFYGDGAGATLAPAYPPNGSQPGMSDDSDALYNSYQRNNQPY
jgi:hypothetical protein